MRRFATPADVKALEDEGSWETRDIPRTTHGLLTRVAERYGDRPAMTFQLTSGPKDPAETLTWSEVQAEVHRTANLFRDLGIGESDVVAFVLPNATETFLTLIAGSIAGVVNPINPLLDPEHIGGILRETDAKVVVTLKSFPKTDVAQKMAKAIALAPNVETVLEVDLLRYLSPPKSWIAGLIRPKNPVAHKAKVLDFNAERKKRPTTLSFTPGTDNRIAALFHTGGTTGLPKIAKHRFDGMIYQAWLASTLIFDETDNLMCPLPLFHVFAAQILTNAVLACGGHLVLPTPQGYRGEGVFDNFWKLIERHKATFIITVPTAVAALMQRKVDADVSTVRSAISGSAPLPLELFRRFKEATGVEIMEGYGLTEATCLVSCNPYEGTKKIGSVGIPLPYTDVRILVHTSDDGVAEMPANDIGEICVANPGVNPGSIYTQEDKNHNLFHYDVYLRTGDLGRIDEDGYLWITGRAKDLIIRSGHNIDPSLIEEALVKHPSVAMSGAIGQPDAYAGELPCAYVELVGGASVSAEELRSFAAENIPEKAAVPKHVEVLDELPKTAVGKVFKPDLRRRAITRVLDDAFDEAGLKARVAEVVEDKVRGLVARIDAGADEAGDVEKIMGSYTIPWERAA
ncbi:MAG: acyl-CoA synthetase [Paracoccaceae bacterium]|nr:acyl-CoA synthetase [Paracoccaceae bacterium]